MERVGESRPYLPCAAAVQETEAVLKTDEHIPAVSITTEDEKTGKSALSFSALSKYYSREFDASAHG
jgi:hypothetical protein